MRYLGKNILSILLLAIIVPATAMAQPMAEENPQDTNIRQALIYDHVDMGPDAKATQPSPQQVTQQDAQNNLAAIGFLGMTGGALAASQYDGVRSTAGVLFASMGASMLIRSLDDNVNPAEW